MTGNTDAADEAQKEISAIKLAVIDASDDRFSRENNAHGAHRRLTDLQDNLDEIVENLNADMAHAVDEAINSAVISAKLAAENPETKEYTDELSDKLSDARAALMGKWEPESVDSTHDRHPNDAPEKYRARKRQQSRQVGVAPSHRP